MDRNGKKIFDRALPNDEGKLRELIGKLRSRGTVLLVVDQPATIGALPVAVARAEGVVVGYLPGLAMRRIADLHPGQAKTDARDAAIIAEAARTMPHTLRALAHDDETVAELTMLSGFDDDLAGQITATKQPHTWSAGADPPGTRMRSWSTAGSPGGVGCVRHHGLMTSQFAVLCVDCVDPKPLALFWCEILGWDIVDQDETGLSISPANDVGPRIDFYPVPEAKVGKNRLHIDLRADGCSTADELDRLLALGARRVDVGQGPAVTWVVLADPEGNEFCLLSRTVQQFAAEQA